MDRQATIERIKELIEWALQVRDPDPLLHEIQNQLDEVQCDLQAFEKTIEAAQAFIDTIDLAERTGARIDMPPVQWQALYGLRKALADMDAPLIADPAADTAKVYDNPDEGVPE